MQLLERVTDVVGSEEKASRALGTLFMVISLAMPKPQFDLIQRVTPDVDLWVKKSLSGAAARTGEMLALTDASNVAERLRSIGLDDAQVQQVIRAVAERLSDTLDTETMDALQARLPLLATATA